MNKFDEAKKELKDIGFYFDKDDYEDDLIIQSNLKISCGVLAKENSTRFKSFKKMVAFVENNLGVMPVKDNGEYHFTLKGKSYNTLTLYKEENVVKIFMHKSTMNKFDEAKKELKDIGFYFDKDDYQDDLIIQSNLKISCGVLAKENSTRFKSFKKMVAFVENNLGVMPVKDNGEYHFTLKGKSYNTLTLYKEENVVKIFMHKSK